MPNARARWCWSLMAFLAFAATAGEAVRYTAMSGGARQPWSPAGADAHPGLAAALRAFGGDGSGDGSQAKQRARMERIAAVDLMRGRDRRTIELYAITGVGSRPTFAWATAGGGRLFAYADPRVVVVERGWESVRDTLATRQQRAEAEHLRAVRDAVSHPLDVDLLIRGARLYDGGRGLLGPPVDVLVRDGRVAEVGEGSIGSRAARKALVVEAAGRALVPAPAVAGPDGWAALLARVASAPPPARGPIHAGEPANLRLLDGDPSATPGVLPPVAFVLDGGIMYHPGEVRMAFGLAPLTASLKAAPPVRKPKATRLDGETRPLPSRYYR